MGAEEEVSGGSPLVGEDTVMEEGMSAILAFLFCAGEVEDGLAVVRLIGQALWGQAPRGQASRRPTFFFLRLRRLSSEDDVELEEEEEEEEEVEEEEEAEEEEEDEEEVEGERSLFFLTFLALGLASLSGLGLLSQTEASMGMLALSSALLLKQLGRLILLGFLPLPPPPPPRESIIMPPSPLMSSPFS